MASGDTLLVFTPAAATFPASDAPTFDTRNLHLVLDFDDSTDETCYFPGVLPRHYGGGGLTVTVVWMATTATSDGCQWEVAFERHEDDTTDLDSPDFAAVQSAASTTATVSGQSKYTSVTFTSGAQMDSLVAGESFRMSVNRDVGYGSNLSGDTELLRVEIKES